MQIMPISPFNSGKFPLEGSRAFGDGGKEEAWAITEQPGRYPGLPEDRRCGMARSD